MGEDLRKIRAIRGIKWRLGPRNKKITRRSSPTGQVAACQSCKNMSQALISEYGVSCSGADLHRKQANKPRIDALYVLRVACPQLFTVEPHSSLLFVFTSIPAVYSVRCHEQWRRRNDSNHKCLS